MPPALRKAHTASPPRKALLKEEDSIILMTISEGEKVDGSGVESETWVRRPLA
jgi:hypothetical protein